MAPVIAPSTVATRVCSRSTVVSELIAWEAARMPSRSMVPLVTAVVVEWSAVVERSAGWSTPGSVLVSRAGPRVG